MTIKEIDQQISDLKKQRSELVKQEREDFKKQAQKNVGRCFKVDGQYVKVIGIPQEEYTMTDVIFNEYQYPAIFLGFGYDDSVIPFYEDTLFSAAWGEGYDRGMVYEEIPVEEFNAEFERLLLQFRDRIKV